ncbi:DUF2357 domain-containing protein [Bacillus thuringiensis]|uniref:DUF2357 domain-containing protein n=1 Tax=Bacillus thuringiensis TaxID=1428 RepID=A0A9X6WIE5_BACTU|nr:DUF2357 domain-containing protein [Bacillus thuringiensis]PFJ31826.1 hypothetical protein COJ15_29435 [Bacillus thuringiensis]
MVTPFKVIFRQNHNQQNEKEIPVTNFVQDETILYRMEDENVPEVMENKRLLLEFICEDETARLYMDGLDTLPEWAVEIGEDNTGYLTSEMSPIYLYDNSDNARNNTGYYPLIPGYYRIKVVVQNISYYSWLKVQPKQITEEQWVSMRDEVEETLNGLAQDLIRKNASLGVNSSLPIPIHILRKLYIVKKDYLKWINSLKSIQSEPRMRIRKEYDLVPEGKAGIVDATSIRYRSRHPESRDYVYTPKHTRNHNLLENQWIKKIMRFISREMNDLLVYLHDHKEKVKQEIKEEQRFQRFRNDESVQMRLKSKVLDELIEYERFVRCVRSECSLVLKEDWMEEVEEARMLNIPHALHLDLRYRQLYQLYRLLKNEELSISLDTNYDYYWKRTDLLYEIWGFLQLVDGLQNENVGFEVVKGWIFDTNSNSKTIQVPFLEPGTVIEFKKGNIKLNLVYDETLPSEKKDTTINKPIYTGGPHTRPDVRMDIYENDEYIGTIMVDFKYRPLQAIWNDYRRKKTDAMRQLISYRDNMKSPFLYNNSFSKNWHLIRTVHEVWAVYPNHEANMQPKNPMDNHQVRLMELTPLEEKDNFHLGIAETIQKVVDAYHEFFQRA